MAPTGSYNTVRVSGMGADGSVIISGRNKVTDFEKFQAQKPAEPDNPDNPGNPDNPDKPNNPDSPDKPGNPSSPSNPQRKKLNAPAKVKAAQLSTSHNVKITFSKVSGAKDTIFTERLKRKAVIKRLVTQKSKAIQIKQ